MLVELTLSNGEKLAINPDCVASFCKEDFDPKIKCVKLNIIGGSCYFVQGDYQSVKEIIGVDAPELF